MGWGHLEPEARSGLLVGVRLTCGICQGYQSNSACSWGLEGHRYLRGAWAESASLALRQVGWRSWEGPAPSWHTGINSACHLLESYLAERGWEGTGPEHEAQSWAHHSEGPR